jgi:hypothetical protein
VAYDATTGEKLLTAEEEEAGRLVAEAGRAEAEAGRARAEQRLTEEAEARLKAEQEKKEEADARREAEELNRQVMAQLERLRARYEGEDGK